MESGGPRIDQWGAPDVTRVLPLAHAHTVKADTSRLLISSSSLDA